MLGSKGSDAKYFSSSKKGESVELRNDLNSNNRDKVKEAVKKVIASMTVGKDVSELFADVIKSMPTDNIELKKLVYLYIINYARSKPEQAILVVNTFQKDALNRSNPLIRALAIRTMGCIRVDQITQFLCDPLQASLKDSDPYVRKTAAICVAKLFDINRELVEDQGFLDTLRDLISDSNHTVVANAVAALLDIAETSGQDVFQMDGEMLARLQTALDACTEWGQVAILDCLAKYNPDMKEAEEIVERVTPRLKHANPAVALSAVKVIMKYLDVITDENIVAQAVAKLQPPLITLLSEQKAEIQYVALRNIRLIVQKRPEILVNSVKHFFCKYNDPIYVKMEKLEIMISLASMDNIDKVLLEFKEYASEIDVDFVRKAVLAIGRCAIKLPEAANKCIVVLLGLIDNKVNYVVQQSIVVIRDIFRKYPNRYETIITKLCSNLEVLDEPEAKAAMIWIVGEYGHRIDNVGELLERWCETFEDEPAVVQLQLLTAVVKVFLRQPEAMRTLVQTVLKLSTENTDNPDLRDRGYVYWRLLSTDPAATVQVVLGEKLPIEDDTSKLDTALLDKLIGHLSTLASVYYKTPDAFVKDARHLSGIDRGDAKEEDDSPPEADGDEGIHHNADDEYVPDAKDDGKDSGNAINLDFLNLGQISAPTPSSAQQATSAAPSGGGAFDIFMLGASAGALANPESKSQQAIALQELGDVVYSGTEGVEFRVRFGRENNKPVAFFTLKNNSASSLDVVPLRFNHNYFALSPAGAIPALGQGKTVTTAIPLNVSTPEEFENVNASKQDGSLLCAAKIGANIPKFPLVVPAEILFAESGALDQAKWIEEWRSNASLQQAKLGPFAVSDSAVSSVTAKLKAKHVQCLAVRQVGGSEHCFLSGFWRHTPVLAEMIFGDGKVTFNVKSASKKVSEIAAEALKSIVTK